MLLKIASQTSAMNSKYEPEELKLNALFFFLFFFPSDDLELQSNNSCDGRSLISNAG